MLLTTSLVAAVCAGLALISSTEIRLAGRHREATEVREAASAALARAAADLKTLPDWTPALAGMTRSGFVDSTETPTLADGTVFSIPAETAALQARSDAESRWGADNPRWIPFAWGPAGWLLPGGHPSAGIYLVAWVADDGADAEGDPRADRNGILQVEALAVGGSGARHAVRGVFGRASLEPHALKHLAWRPAR